MLSKEAVKKIEDIVYEDVKGRFVKGVTIFKKEDNELIAHVFYDEETQEWKAILNGDLDFIVNVKE